ncbi:hypothetical protein Hanom_Chr05g00399541 [Helianthus anomalus]
MNPKKIILCICLLFSNIQLSIYNRGNDTYGPLLFVKISTMDQMFIVIPMVKFLC